MKRRKQKIILTQRDREILLFLWKWKLVSTATICHGFYYQPLSPRHAYRRLVELELGKYIKRSPIAGLGTAWSLGNKGYHLVKGDLPEHTFAGRKSTSLEHDVIVSGIHIGPLANGTLKVKTFSDTELWNISPGQYPEWVPRNSARRPDGYWRVEIGGKSYTIALEVELTKKSKENYERYARFYNSNKLIFRVIWVVKRPSIGERILSIFEECNKERAPIHNFVLLEDVILNGWEATIFLGLEKGEPLTTLLQNEGGKKGDKCPSLPNLNLRILPCNLNTWNASSHVPKFDSIGFQPIPNSYTQSSIESSFLTTTSGKKQPLTNNG